ncbi:hypothetical protein BU25DRAFT_428935 [Macroventuria anomochaeta]|uniref:Uncharacterized protein n=1 Tax=Macroventuria anomochaeta TaxID=301207 RepID=A0ACB6SB64_9PLEO|nr:uncharacterized protein BU25DRAFT_428935 [Macroventuria anomochaeta]KAF2631213.1 hypothetical protein BU25DRAFT_428935 [Macroventuria anomochaeta]
MAASHTNTISITNFTTATTIITINGINFLTDPVFCPPSKHDNLEVLEKLPDGSKSQMNGIPPLPHLTSVEGPALQLHDRPPIDAILLSYEDYIDNLDPEDRKFIDGRKIFAAPGGTKNLAPRPGVIALKPWETLEAVFGGTKFKITGTSCQHIPGGEVTGIVPSFESAIWIGKKRHIQVAQVHLGNAQAPLPSGSIQITMDGKSAFDLVRSIGLM